MGGCEGSFGGGVSVEGDSRIVSEDLVKSTMSACKPRTPGNNFMAITICPLVRDSPPSIVRFELMVQ